MQSLKMIVDNYYQVAGHVFRLSFSNKVLSGDSLNNYAPFRISEGKSNCLFLLSVADTLSGNEAYKPVGQFDDDIASIGIFKSEKGNFRFRIAHPQSKDCCMMDVDTYFSKAEVLLPNDEWLRIFCLNNCLMLLYAFSTAGLDTVLMHASVIKNGDAGFLFLGKSGTGKSTHSRLWLNHIEGSELLNDDNPVIRIIDNKAYVFGSPWSGKTSCYRNESVPLKGIVKLKQAPENKIKELSSLLAYSTLLPACSSMRWEDKIASGVHRTVELLITRVGCYQLDCLPDQAAAELCAATVREKK